MDCGEDLAAFGIIYFLIPAILFAIGTIINFFEKLRKTQDEKDENTTQNDEIKNNTVKSSLVGFGKYVLALLIGFGIPSLGAIICMLSFEVSETFGGIISIIVIIGLLWFYSLGTKKH